MTDLAAALNALGELAKAATPGPWEFSDSTDARGHKGEFRAPDPFNGFMLVGPWTRTLDGYFIAAANPLVVAALVEVALAAEALMAKGPNWTYADFKRYGMVEALAVLREQIQKTQEQEKR